MEIIGNVADNACKWATSKVLLRLENQNKHVLIRVSDDGPGMPTEKIGHVLKRGARLDQSTEGQGIGLAVVRELVEQVYNGELSIDSSPDGTDVCVVLPK